jgi:hypothetical protein
MATSPSNRSNPGGPLPKNYVEVRERCKKFLFDNLASDAKGWTIKQATSPGAITLEIAEYEKREGGILTARGKLKFPDATPLQVLDLIVNLDSRPKWDSQMKTGQVHCGFDTWEEKGHECSADIAHLVYKGIWPVSERDLCLLRSWSAAKDGSSCWLISESVEDEAVPVGCGCGAGETPPVRAALRECGYFMEKMEGGGCEVTYISSLDFGGSLPVWFVNLLLLQQPRTLDTMRDLLWGKI